MLQEIISKITAPGLSLVDRFKRLFYDATVGLLKEYQEKTLELVRITAASCYLQGIKALRQIALVLFGIVFAAVVLAFALVITPMAMIMVSALPPAAKVWSVLGVGLVFIAASAAVLIQVFSEKRWMEITKSSEFLEKVLNR